MSKKFRLLMVLVLVVGLLGGLMSASTVSADPDTGTMIEIPAIAKGTAFGQAGWDTKIQIQNTGAAATWVLVDFWSVWSGTCPPTTDPSWLDEAVMWLPAGAVWTLHNAIPTGAESAFVWSCGEDPGTSSHPSSPCTTVGELLAVTVDRWGPDPSGATEISSSYTGVADPGMVGSGPAYEYYAPYVMNGYNDLDTIITMQNSGDRCASIWIYYKAEANCEMQKSQHVEQIRPGEALSIGPNRAATKPAYLDMVFPSPEITSGWLGSAYVTSNVPLAIVVDQLSVPPSENQGTLLSMRGMPYGQTEEYKWYADLLYREISGYSSSIQVQNLTHTSQPTFVTVDFFDQSGDEILYVGDWVCRNAAATFYLPAIADLGINFPMGYVGAAEIQSSDQIDYPGGEHDGQPIFAVVDIKKTKVWDSTAGRWRHATPGEIQGGAYNAHPEHQKLNAWGWAMPFIAKEQEGVTSRIAVRNNANCNKITGRIDIKDETGNTVAYIPVPYLHPKHMKVFDLNYFGQVWPGFVGAATFTVTGVEQLCDTDGDGETDIKEVMPSVVVLNYGYEQDIDPFPPQDPGIPRPTDVGGDLTRVYEAIPYHTQYSPCIITVSGHVIDDVTLEPINEAEVKLDGVSKDTTDSTGYYEFTHTWTADPTNSAVLTAVHTDYTSSDPTSVTITGCDDVVANFELHRECTVSLNVYVEDKETGDPITTLEKAMVTVSNGPTASDFTLEADAVAGDGHYDITGVAFDPDNVVIVKVDVPFYNVAFDSVYIPECGGSADISFQLHDTPMEQILLYYGNGGNVPDLTPLEPADPMTAHNYFAAKAVFEYFGYNVDYTGDWPTDPDLEEYKVIFLLGPGNDSSPKDPASNLFTPYQVTQIDAFMRNGGRLVVMSDISDTTAGGPITVENTLLGELNDIVIHFDDDDGDGWVPMTQGVLASDIPLDQLTRSPAGQDVATLDFNTAISVTVPGAKTAPLTPFKLASLAAPHPAASNTYAAVDCMSGISRLAGYSATTDVGAGFAGDVVVIGDLDWMDDYSFMGTISYDPVTGNPDYVWPDWPADNENLLLNIFNF